MFFPPKVKLEKVVSADRSRPVLSHTYLRADPNDPTRGTLEACDTYKLARVPVELEEGDTEGLLTVESLKAAQKANRLRPRLSANGTADVPGGPSFPRPEEGTFPNTATLIPEGEIAFTVGINAKFLHELAQGLGVDAVRLDFLKVGDEPSAVRPIQVRPIGGQGDGLIMPIR